MPGTERSSGHVYARVERSLFGDGLVKGRIWDRLVCTLEAINVHGAESTRGADFDMCSAGGVPRGVYGRVYTGGCTRTGGYRDVFTPTGFRLFSFPDFPERFLTFLNVS